MLSRPLSDWKGQNFQPSRRECKATWRSVGSLFEKNSQKQFADDTLFLFFVHLGQMREGGAISRDVKCGFPPKKGVHVKRLFTTSYGYFSDYRDTILRLMAEILHHLGPGMYKTL